MADYYMMKTNFRGRQFSEEEVVVSAILADNAELLDEMLVERLVASPETTLAKRKLEEAIMWANKSISLHGLQPKHHTAA